MHRTSCFLKGICRGTVKFDHELLRGAHRSRPCSTVRPEEQLIRPLPIFIDSRFPGPDPRVSAYFLNTPVDLQDLRTKLEMLGCPTAIWQGQVLYCESCEHLGQQECSAVFLPDGCTVCWHMSSATELITLQLAMGSRAERRVRSRFGAREVDARSRPGTVPQPASVERLDVVEESKKTNEEGTEDHKKSKKNEHTRLDPLNGCLTLTSNLGSRASDKLGLSLGLASAVRLDALEKRIEKRLEADWESMHGVGQHTLNLSNVSHCIFIAENGLHALRYELNTEAGALDAPDLLWEHASAEHLHDQVIRHFDIRRRTTILNERLGYSLDYLHTLGEHVRHLYSVRLERMIIALIFFELCVGVMQLTQHLTHSTAAHPERGVLRQGQNESCTETEINTNSSQK